MYPAITVRDFVAAGQSPYVLSDNDEAVITKLELAAVVLLTGVTTSGSAKRVNLWRWHHPLR